jgi:hypothetical protein
MVAKNSVMHEPLDWLQERLESASPACCGRRSPRSRRRRGGRTWTQTLALDGPLPVAKPKILRHRLLAIAARIPAPHDAPIYAWTDSGPGQPPSPTPLPP